MIEEIADKNFQSEIAAGDCLALFYKDPCPYCKTMKGVLEKFARKNRGVRIFQINGLENAESAAAFGVERFPEVLFFKDGREAARQKGLTNPQGLTKIFKGI